MTRRTLARLLGAVVVTTALSGLAIELAYLYVGIPAWVAAFFSLSAEGNLPTWVATCILFSCSLLVASIARVADAFRGHWWFLAVFFAYMSLDEAVEIHEHLGGVFETGGILYFSWVIPGAVVVTALGLAYLPFLSRLEPTVRRRFVLAGALYVGGALLMELPAGWWTERHGDDNLGYALLDWIEETLELGGASLFLVTLWTYRFERPPTRPRTC